jgi:hypothetical protein
LGQVSGDELEGCGILNRALDACYEKDPNIVSREIAGEQILVPIRKKSADMAAIYVLNETGARIWSLLDGRRSLGEIVSLLADEYEVQPEIARADLVEVTDALMELGMLRLVEHAL